MQASEEVVLTYWRGDSRVLFLQEAIRGCSFYRRSCGKRLGCVTQQVFRVANWAKRVGPPGLVPNGDDSDEDEGLDSEVEICVCELKDCGELTT